MPSLQQTGRSGILQNIPRVCLALLAATIVANHPAVAAFEPAIPPRPSHISLEDVSQKYPVTLMNKLFSSVPKREYALRNVNLSLGHASSSSASSQASSVAIDHDDDDGVILLVGRSASGKSTLLRMLAGIERPVDGRVVINGHGLDEDDTPAGVIPGLPSWVTMGLPPLPHAAREATGGECYGAQPVILSGKPDFDDSLLVGERIVQMALRVINLCDKESNSVGQEYRGELSSTLIQTLVQDMASILVLLEEQCSSPPSKLSPSGQYLFGIACGCMMSIAPSISTSNTNQNHYKNGIHYPILLLDELYDTEHPSTLQSCGEGLSSLIRHGGVMISATHRPGHFEGLTSRTVTLSGGRVLRDEKLAVAR